jgi:lipopolysaccharide transport system permease protein
MRTFFFQIQKILSVGWMLAKRTLAIDIRTSYLGLLWPLIYPVAYTALFLSLKPIVHSSGDSEVDYALHIFIGLSLWQLWFEGLQMQMRAVKAQRSLLSRAELDPAALFLSGFFVQVVYLLPRLALALTFAAIFGRLNSIWPAFIFVTMSLLVILNGSVIGFVIQPFSTLLPDIGRLIQSVSLAIMLTGGVFVIFPKDINDSTLSVLALNPLGPLVEAARAPLLAQITHFDWASWIWIFITLSALAVQIRLARKVLPVLLERIGS